MPHSRAIPLQFSEEPSDLVADFNQLVDGGLIGLGGASADLDRTLAADGGLVDLRLRNAVSAAVNGVGVLGGEAIGPRIKGQDVGARD